MAKDYETKKGKGLAYCVLTACALAGLYSGIAYADPPKNLQGIDKISKKITASETYSLKKGKVAKDTKKETPSLLASYPDYLTKNNSYSETPNINARIKANLEKITDIDSQINNLKAKEIGWGDYLFWGAKDKLELQLKDAKTDTETDLIKSDLSTVTLDSNMIRGFTAACVWAAYEFIQSFFPKPPTTTTTSGPGYGGGNGPGNN